MFTQEWEWRTRGERNTGGERANTKVHEWVLSVWVLVWLTPSHWPLWRWTEYGSESPIQRTKKGAIHHQLAPLTGKGQPIIGVDSFALQRASQLEGELCGAERESYAVQLKQDAFWLHLCEAACPVMAGVKDALRGCEAGHRDVWYPQYLNAMLYLK